MSPPDSPQGREPARTPFRRLARPLTRRSSPAFCRAGGEPLGRRSVPATAQRGLAAIALAAAILLVSGLLLGAAYVAQQAGDPRQGAQSQRASLAWAQDAVGGFAAAHGRLPCPSSARAGFEDCSAGAKGWLPVRSLAAVAGPGPAALPDMHYVVYRGNGGSTPPDPDLAAEPSAPGEAYTPTLAGGAPVAGYTTPTLSGLDFCAKLRGLLPPAPGGQRWGLGDPLTGGPGTAARAHIPAAAVGAVVNIAYGVAVQSTGVTGSASGVNADLSTPALEAPDRPQDARYTDLVRAVDARALYDGMSCGVMLASIDTLATAQGWSDDAAGYRQGNIAAGAAVSDILKYFLVADGIGAGMAGVDLINGGVAFATNLTKLNASLPGLPLTLPAVMTYIAGIASAVSGLGLNALDFAANGAGLTIDSMYTAAYADVARDALATPVWSGGPALLNEADTQGINGD